MATKVEAARLLTRKAARMKDAGERSDLEAGMAKLLASETGKEVVEESFRIHGGYGYSKEYEIERLYRDAPLLLIGEGTSEIQRMVIGKKLLQGTRSERSAGGAGQRCQTVVSAARPRASSPGAGTTS
jgi:alkylation response protein AidB-like acyl-CoA dehydrogenase